MIVSSFFPGRIRLRNDVFKDDDIFSALYSAVGSHSAVKKVERNERTGSVLVEYISENLPMEKLLALKDEFFALGKLAESYSKKISQLFLKKFMKSKKIKIALHILYAFVIFKVIQFLNGGFLWITRLCSICLTVFLF